MKATDHRNVFPPIRMTDSKSASLNHNIYGDICVCSERKQISPVASSRWRSPASVSRGSVPRSPFTGGHSPAHVSLRLIHAPSYLLCLISSCFIICIIQPEQNCLFALDSHSQNNYTPSWCILTVHIQLLWTLIMHMHINYGRFNCFCHSKPSILTKALKYNHATVPQKR